MKRNKKVNENDTAFVQILTEDTWNRLPPASKIVLLDKCLAIVEAAGNAPARNEQQIYTVGLLLVFIFTGIHCTIVTPQAVILIDIRLQKNLHHTGLSRCILSCLQKKTPAASILTDLELQLFLYKHSLA